MVVAFAAAVALRFEDLDAQNPAYFDFYVQMGLVQALVWGFLARGPMHAWEPHWGWKETMLPLLRNLGVHIALTALLLVALKFTMFSRWFWLLHFGLFALWPAFGGRLHWLYCVANGKIPRKLGPFGWWGIRRRRSVFCRA